MLCGGEILINYLREVRKINEDAYIAFKNKKRFQRNNTRVTVDDYGDSHMYLFGNEIAKTMGDDVFICNGNYYPAVTTRERLSAFVNISLYGGDFIINNVHKWNGEWTNVNKFN